MRHGLGGRASTVAHLDGVLLTWRPMVNRTADSELDVVANLREVRERIAAVAVGAGRLPDDVLLVAVSKAHSIERIEPALSEGHCHFGENRVQEAEVKWASLRERHPDAVLHLVGSLQTNKARNAVALFDVIETLDRPKLADALAREMDRSGKRPACFIEVNLGGEPQKSGVWLEELPKFILLCRDSLALPLTGLMCIPPAAEESAPYFALLAKLSARYELQEASMGMSADYETAVTFGATQVRVGSAIFGPRPSGVLV